jgi:hypothetical protein
LTSKLPSDIFYYYYTLFIWPKSSPRGWNFQVGELLPQSARHMILHDTRTDPSLVEYSCRKNPFDKCISLFKTIISESFPFQCKFVHELYSGFMLFFLGVSLWAVFF